MNKKLIVVGAALSSLLFSWSITAAQDEEKDDPYVVPVDTFTCSFNEGKDLRDLDKVIASWNAWMDEQGADTYGAMTLTPYYYAGETFEIGWLGYWTSQEAMGAGIDNYLTNGSKLADGFADVLTCDSHSHWASVNIKPPEEGQPENLVLMFSNCSISEETEWDSLWTSIGEAAAYMTEQNYRNGAWMLWPVFGGEGELGYDFKWVTAYENYTDFGKAYQHNANGGGRQKMNEIMGEKLDCDTARVYNARVVRAPAAESEN